MKQPNRAASVRARLLQKARAEKLDFNQLLTRFALERFLYRLGNSDQRDLFLLKGALLFDLWFDIPHRPTADADLLGFGSCDRSLLVGAFQGICKLACDDGIKFEADTVAAADIRKDARHAGVRMTLLGLLDGAHCHVQVDIGFGDAVVPGPESAVYPVLLRELPAPRLRVYPRYTVVAEKLHAMADRGMLNSRLKDYFDLWVLALRTEFEGAVLSQAIRATFDRRGTRVPEQLPIGLTSEFARDEQKNTQWTAFLRKNALEQVTLESVIATLAAFLLPVLTSLGQGVEHQGRWRAGSGWIEP